MPLLQILWTSLVITAFVAACAAAVLYGLFRRNPATQWRDRVLNLWTAAHNRAQEEQDALEGIDRWRAGRETALRQQALGRVLAAISVGELEAYPGIGPATVGRLRGAGYANLAALADGTPRVEGLGEKRLGDIRRAVADLTRQALSRLEAGSHAGAVELTNALAALKDEHTRRERSGRARLQAAEAFANGLANLVAEANRITFWNYLRHLTELPVAPHLLDAPLPDLEATLRHADNSPRSAAVSRPPAAIPVEPPRRTPASASAQVRAAAAAAPAAPARQEDFPLLLMELTVQLAYATARADGRVARNERELIEEHVQRRYGYDPVLFNRARAFCARFESEAIDLDACLRRITAACAPALRSGMVELCRQVAEATNDVNKRETTFLENVAERLGVSLIPSARAPAAAKSEPVPGAMLSRPSPNLANGPEPHGAAKACHPPPTPEQDRAALEIDPAIPLTADLIRRQYHLLQERYVPEKVQAMGPDFVKMADQKRTAAHAAATALLAAQGERLESATPEPPQDLRHNPDLDAMFGV